MVSMFINFIKKNCKVPIQYVHLRVHCWSWQKRTAFELLGVHNVIHCVEQMTTVVLDKYTLHNISTCYGNNNKKCMNVQLQNPRVADLVEHAACNANSTSSSLHLSSEQSLLLSFAQCFHCSVMWS